MATMESSWAFAFGILGNIISFLVGLAPLPTFYQIYKKKTAQGFQSLPYIIALFSAMLWIYYALVKKNDSILLITINTYFCLIEVIYISFYFYYAPKKDKIVTVKLFLLFNVFGFGTVCFVVEYLAKGQMHFRVLGYICMSFALAVFAAPLGIVRKVIQTKSVEYMPFSLSFFLTLNAIAWFFYGLFLKDWNIAVPNTLGFVFGILQMLLYLIYRNHKTVQEQEVQKNGNQQDLQEQTIDVDVMINVYSQDQELDQNQNQNHITGELNSTNQRSNRTTS